MPGGAPLTEAMVFLLAGGIGFHHLVVERRAGRRLVVGTSAAGVGAAPERTADVARALGLSATHLEANAELAAENALVDALERGDAVVLWTDLAALPHRRLPAGYGRVVPHLVGVVGFDDVDEEFSLDDGASVPVPVDAARLRLARAEAPGARNEALALGPGVPADAPVEHTAAERVAAAATAHLHAPVGSRGVTGMRRLAAGLRDAGSGQGWLSRFGRGAGLFGALLAFHRAIAHAPHGPAAGRDLWVAGLAELSTMPGVSALRSELGPWREIAAGWHALGEAILPADHPRLAEARGILAAQAERYTRDGIESMRVLAATATRLTRIEAEMEAEFPLGEAATYLHLRELGERLDALASREVEGLERLASLLGRGATRS